MEEHTTAYHIPALLPETLAALDINPSGIYVDSTFGGGGHSKAILGALGPEGRLLGFDRDIDAMANVPEDSRFTFVHSDFRYVKNFLRYHNIQKIDGLLADLGVSFHHFDDGERGFSFRAEAPLDMRMNRSAELTAATILNTYPERKLAEIFRTFSDIKNPNPLVRSIIKRREEKQFANTSDLLEAIAPLINPRREKKDLARIFQALRIETNDETGSLRHLLLSLPDIIKPGGRAAIITYHSIEDRMVKNIFRSGNIEGKTESDFFGIKKCCWTLVNRQPITPSEEEVLSNPRSRSAKLRAAIFTP